eukprot:COSAG01_NODE_19799_length_988_cov_6.313836_1_plen_26_part_01
MAVASPMFYTTINENAIACDWESPTD